MAPFELLSSPLFSLADQRVAAFRYAESTLGKALSATPLQQGNDTYKQSRLRIGYLSADFRAHPVVFLLLAVLEAHDRKAFDVACYAYGTKYDDTYRQRVETLSAPFRDLAGLSDSEAAGVIARDRVDILVDLNGFTGEARPGIVAARPAKLIVNWLGYPGSMGHPRLADYLIGDPVLTPLDHAGHYSETLALMPHCYQPNDNTQPIGVAPSRSLAGLPERALVFCCFNQSYKITPEMFAIWCRLLAAVPDSVLWLLQPGPEAQASLQFVAAAHGVTAERLVFGPPLPLAEHLGRLQLADLALDTFPYTSGATASNALWAGVPLLTWMGDSYVGRMAASLLNTLGLPELVAHDAVSYYDLAYSLATERDRLAALRINLASRRQTSPLFDTQQFVRDLERLYVAMWQARAVGSCEPIVLDTLPNL